MGKVGVMAVVEGLGGFLSDMGKIGGALDMLKPKATGLMNMFDNIGDSIGRFGESVLRVAEVALGVMLRDAIEWVIGGLKDMVIGAVEAGAEFQLLELRLMGLNMQVAQNSKVFAAGATDAEIYAQTMAYAAEMTERQMTWLMRLAAVTPFDATDIANIFTMATSYGFAADDAQQLTENTINFAAAMGLESEAIDRIMVNFGQMVQRGKITTRELNDLARGSMMPIADVLEIIADRMGISVKKLTEEISKPGGGVDAQYFIDAFNEMTETQIRFQGASERMARTFTGAMENVKQTTRDLLGMYVAQPVLDVLGERIAGILDELTKPENWERITTALGGIGEGLAEIVTGVLGITPEPGNFVDWLMDKIDAIKAWIDTHKQGIINFFLELKRIITGAPEETTMGVIQGNTFGIDWNQMVPQEEFGEGFLGGVEDIAKFIREDLIPALDEFKAWVEENKPLIDEFFSTVGEIFGSAFTNVFDWITSGGKGGKGKGEGGGGVLDMLKSFMQWVIDNKEGIAQWVELFVRLATVYIIMSTVNTIALTLLINFCAMLLSFVSASGVVLFLSALTSFLASLAVEAKPELGLEMLLNFFTGLTGIDFTTLTTDVTTFFETLKNIDVKATAETWAKNLWESLVQWLKDNIPTYVPQIVEAIRTLLTNLTMTDSGKEVGDSFIGGLVQGIENGAGLITTAITNIVQGMIGTIMNLLNAKSPSKVMADIGENVIGGGLAQGIENFVGPLMSTMSTAMRNVTAAAAVPSQTSTSYQYNSSYNLTINSNANAEQVAADFGMMQSMAGA